jgi:hypothetical protein
MFFKTGLSTAGFIGSGFDSEATGIFMGSFTGTIALGVFFLAGESD